MTGRGINMRKEAISLVVVGLLLAASSFVLISTLSGEDVAGDDTEEINETISFRTDTLNYKAKSAWNENKYTLAVKGVGIPPATTIQNMKNVTVKVIIGNESCSFSIDKVQTTESSASGSSTVGDVKIGCTITNGMIGTNANLKGLNPTFVLERSKDLSSDTVTIEFSYATTDKNGKTMKITVSVEDLKSIEPSSGISLTPSISGANVILDVNINVGDKIASLKDPRILVVAKYGSNIINVYSKPVLDSGVGTDKIVLSKLGLTQVVLQVVDGFQPASDGSISSICYCVYDPVATG